MERSNNLSTDALSKPSTSPKHEYVHRYQLATANNQLPQLTTSTIQLATTNYQLPQLLRIWDPTCVSAATRVRPCTTRLPPSVSTPKESS
eukprot:gene3433-6072_t